MEIWKDVVGYEGIYQVSNLGRIKSIDRLVWHSSNKSYSKLKGVILKLDKKNKLYEQIHLCKNRKSKNFLVHRIVAQAFIPNTFNKSQVNHIDENKFNNKASNLEWVTQSENINHGNRNKIVSEKNSKKVKRIDKNNNIKIYDSATQAELDGFSRFCISMCCKNKIKSHKGYKWEFKLKIKEHESNT
jgi:hypothetical protein